ncbi:MAG: Kelch repeat-containing protein [Gammaproteobacteria bacterium]
MDISERLLTAGPLMPSRVPFYSRRCMAAAAFRDGIYFFGGVGAGRTESILDVASDLWRFDSGTLAWTRIPEAAKWPEPRRCAGWAVQGERTYLWGGSGIARAAESLPYTAIYLSDCWSFDPTNLSWEKVWDTDDQRSSPGDVAWLSYPHTRVP